MNCALGIDLGATNIKGLALSSTGQVLASVTAPTLDNGNGQWRQNVRRVAQHLERTLGGPADCIGIAAPGLVAEDQHSIACLPERLRGIEGFAWQEYLGAKKAVPILNDGHAALVGELWQGVARGQTNVILLTLGTGVGGAALVDGRLLRGYLGRAGHLGHLSLNPLGPLDVAKTPGSLELAIGDCSVFQRSSGRFATNHALLAAMRKGDAQASAIWIESVRALAAAIASLVNVLSPELVLLGGGTAKAGPALFRPLAKFLAQFEWRPNGAKVKVARAKLGDRAGAFGAACNALGLARGITQ